MFFNGKVHKVKTATKGIRCLFDFICEEQLKKIYNPLKEYIKSLNDLDYNYKAIAIKTFIEQKRDKEYPECLRMEVENSLESCQFLVKHLIPDLKEEVTEANKDLILKGIYYHHNDREMEMIQETRGTRDANI